MVQCNVSLVKITFVDNGDIQKVQITFDMSHGLVHTVHSGPYVNTQYTVSRTSSVYSFSFLRSIQSYSTTFACCRIASMTS